MSIAGNWTLNYSFGCSGGYSQVPITFNNDGTWTSAPFKGQWAVVGGNVQFVFEPTPSAVYSGVVTGGAMVGMQTNFNLGVQGCWYATTGTIPAAHATAKKVAHAEQLDLSGAHKKK
ncbi:MAG TPA: hypothetical protein VOA80_13810 [Thermoanaerobaculia bacterium]|nr:hypothetical protein [Thermoanaerobaculia bacterium]